MMPVIYSGVSENRPVIRVLQLTGSPCTREASLLFVTSLRFAYKTLKHVCGSIFFLLLLTSQKETAQLRQLWVSFIYSSRR